MPTKQTTIKQKYLDEAGVDTLQKKLDERLSRLNEEDLRLDVMIAFSILKACFKNHAVERTNE